MAYYVYNLLVRLLRPGQRLYTMEAQKILKKSDESAIWLRIELPSMRRFASLFLQQQNNDATIGWTAWNYA